MTQDSSPNDSSNLMRYAGLGLELTVAVTGLALLGNFIDQKWATGPIGLMAGMAIGVTYALYRCVRVLKSASS